MATHKFTQAQREKWTKSVTRSSERAFEETKARMGKSISGQTPGSYSAVVTFNPNWWESAVDSHLRPSLDRVQIEASVITADNLGYREVLGSPDLTIAMALRLDDQILNLYRYADTIASRVVTLTEEANAGEWDRETYADSLGIGTALVAAAGPMSDGIADGMGDTEAGAASHGAQNDTVVAIPLPIFAKTKTWEASFVNTRETHADASGQTVLIADFFLVGGWQAMYPYDWSLPAGERVNCQCGTIIEIDESIVLLPGEDEGDGDEGFTE
jgi:hypothetical protein